MNNEAFEKVLDSGDFTTGGGSASALAGAMAAALVAMVAKLSLKKEYGLPPEELDQLAAEADSLKEELLKGAGEDIEAFARVKEAYGLPKNSDAEKTNRAEQIEKGFITAARVPAGNGEKCRRVFEMAKMLDGRSNPAAASDLDVALGLAETGLKGCLANVEINLPSIKDPAALHQFKGLLDELQKDL